MIEAFEAVNKRGPVTEWELSCIQSVWNAHYEHIHAHHSNEDDLLAPWLAERINLPEKVSDDLRRSIVGPSKESFFWSLVVLVVSLLTHQLEICFSLAHTYILPYQSQSFHLSLAARTRPCRSRGFPGSLWQDDL